jgi:hypothetical protein
MSGVSAKLRAMVGIQSAKSTSGVWKALIKLAHFDHLFAIPIVFVLPRFAWYTLPMSCWVSHDGDWGCCFEQNNHHSSDPTMCNVDANGGSFFCNSN